MIMLELLKGRVGEKVDDFVQYVESAEFEADLGDLGLRLGLSAEELSFPGATHWERANHKLKLIGKHVALETILPLTALASFEKISLGKRLRAQLGWLFVGGNVLRIAFHCYQVFFTRREASKVVDIHSY
jgi:hypothetical protein